MTPLPSSSLINPQGPPFLVSNAADASPNIHGIPISTSAQPLSSITIEPIAQERHSCSDRLRAIAEKISLFIRNNWKYILLYILAWTLILICHHTVAATLTIWLGIGLGSGIVFGIFSANVLDKHNQHKEINSLWNLIDYGLRQLDPNGTRQFLLATIIASISALIYAIPEAIGFTIGALLGNQLSITAVYGRRFREDEEEDSYTTSHLQQIHRLKTMINHYQIIKNQIILQKQLDLIAQEQNSSTLSSTLESVKLQCNVPLLYLYDIVDPSDKVIYQENFEASIQTINAKILYLMQSLKHLKEEPNRVIED